MPVKDKIKGNRIDEGDPSDCEENLTPVEGKRIGRKIGQKEPQTVIQIWLSLSQTNGAFQSVLPIKESQVSWKWPSL